MTNRIRSRLDKLGKNKLLVPFFTAGYPDMKTSFEFVRVAADNGADFVELGMPFSDPLADGPLIQHSSHVALQQGTNLDQILDGVSQLRKHTNVPIILMGYYNPIWSYGEERFLRDASAAGVDGLIIPDLPVDEAHTYSAAIRKYDLSAIFLVAPTSTPDRIRLIDRRSTDFIYAVTITGVTGARTQFDTDTDRYLGDLAQRLKKPFVAGFGVSSPESARRLCHNANGVVIGSALVSIIREARSKPASLQAVGGFLRRIRSALD
ncbi:MAG: tryptophan synthase subunit alpha [candidate division Zixibacteria bacterium]|nr:tryptophan synthase subunit alpha [candidate division Zixibacteria bacterium]